MTLAEFLSGGGIGAVAAVVGYVVLALIKGVFGRDKDKAEATAIITDAASGWAKTMQKTVDDMHTEVAEVRGEIRKIRYAIEDYTEVVEGILPAIEPGHPAEVAAVRKAGRELRQVL